MRGHEDRGRRWRRFRRKVAVPAGAVAAALLFFLGVPSAQAVSAQKYCSWKHTTHWADSLDDGASYTYGNVQCDRIIRVATTCRAVIQMGTASSLGFVGQRSGCNISAQLTVRRGQVINYGSSFVFTLRLVDKRLRWTEAFVGRAKPNRGCTTWFSRTAQHVLQCTNEHEDGEYLPGPAARR
jgi:hypothetical protein